MSDLFYVPQIVHLIIIRSGEVLLLHRSGTGFLDGMWCLPTGKVDPNESPRQAAIREAKEEVGIEIIPSLSTVLAIQVPHVYEEKKLWHECSFFFLADKWEGEIRNAEPHKHSEARFFPLGALPENMIKAAKAGLRLHMENIPYGEMGSF